MHHFATAYLAPVSYYVQLYAATEGTRIEQWEHYVKQSYRNRCVIATAQGPLPLTIPTESNGGEKCLMRDVRISDHGNWRHLHWNALEAAYRQSPFFEYYADDFRPFYEKKFDFLVDYNEQLCQLVCQLIDIDTSFQRTDSYIAKPSNTIIDLRDAIHPKKELMDDASFSAVPYYQVFQERLGFLPNLSIIDLLFNMGPEAILVLQKSIK